MSNDIKSILERMAVLEGKITPISVKHGLNPQQKSVHQLPALFKPRDISTVLKSKTDPEHPMKGELVGDSVKPKQNALDEAMGEIEEDMVSRVKKDLTHYLDQLTKKMSDDGRRDRDDSPLDKLEKKTQIDRALKVKAVDAVEKKQAEEDQELAEDPTQQEIGSAAPPAPMQDPQLPESAVKSYTMEDGTTLEAYGDRARGFELRRGARKLPTRFRNMDDADIAVKLFQKRKANQAQDLDQDYIEER
jgi:hypothetical protein